MAAAEVRLVALREKDIRADAAGSTEAMSCHQSATTWPGALIAYEAR
jgi:hypothetical protein